MARSAGAAESTAATAAETTEEVAEQVETTAEATEQQQAAETTTTETTEAAEAAETETTTREAPRESTDWKDRRIATLTARLREAQRQQTAQPSAAGDDAITVTKAELDRLVDQQSSEKAVRSDFDRRCNSTADAGRAEFEDFGTRVDAMRGLLVDARDEMQYNQMLAVVMEVAPDPAQAARLLHELGGDLSEVSRIMALSPVRMGIELTRRAATASGGDSASSRSAPAVSGAPRPIRPVQPGGGANARISPSDPDRSQHLTTEEWMRRRQADVTAARQASRGGR